MVFTADSCAHEVWLFAVWTYLLFLIHSVSQLYHAQHVATTRFLGLPSRLSSMFKARQQGGFPALPHPSNTSGYCTKCSGLTNSASPLYPPFVLGPVSP